MPDETSPFGATYARAREKFLQAAAGAGASVESHAEPCLGAEGEALALDVARLGPDDACALLLISSGCHGVEGYCGSGLQVALLRDEEFLARARNDGVALLFLHALNPWGFSHGRRVTREGVDLNRNFVRFPPGGPRNAGYDTLAETLLPPEWPPSPACDLALARHAQTHGLAALQAAVTGGQYHHPDGLFYGGAEPTWANLVLRRVLRRHAGRCARLGWIDVHSGLGEGGACECILACRDDPAARDRAHAWWGAALTSTYDGTSNSSRLTGEAWEAAYEECPQAEYTGISLEFGTQPKEVVLDALRADHWAARAGAPASEALREGVRLRMREAFFTETPAWKQAVVAQGRDVVLRGVRGVRSACCTRC